MKILVISSTPWDNANSFGNTFSNLFENMSGVEIYNICLKHGVSNNTVVEKACQLTDKTVLKSIYKINYDPARIIESQGVEKDFETEISSSARKKRSIISFIIRDLIWKLGRWKKSKILNDFIKSVNPDVIYLPIYSSPYMCDVQSYIVDKIGVKVVGHISDDVYDKTTSTSCLAKAYNNKTRKKVKALIEKCEYLEVFAENMKREYQKIFNIPCYLIGKGVKPEQVKDINYDISNDKEVSFVYTGNIGTGRYELLSKIGRALDAEMPSAKLKIYSATPLTEEMQKSFSLCKSIRFMGAVSSAEVLKIQQQADFLIHVESFSKEGISSAKMSFSTKIIDYMLSGKPIFAVGPSEVNSIEVLKNHNLAIVVENESNLWGVLNKLANNQIDLKTIGNNVYNYLKNDRNIYEIQNGIKTRLQNLVK